MFTPHPGTKCSRESLKFCLEMLILRSRIMAEHSVAAFNLLLANFVQLSHDWNSAFLEIANVIIPKWQIRARHIVDTTILQRQWRRQQEQRVSSRVETKTEAVAETTTPTTHPVGVEAIIEEHNEADEKKDVEYEMNVVAERTEIPRTEAFDKDIIPTSDEEKTSRKRLAIAVTGCVVFLFLQLCIGLTLLIQAGLPLGLIFQIACIVYIAYLLQSVSVT